MLTNAWLYVVLCLGLNIVVGYAGLLDLGYAAFFAVGAYATGILTVRLGIGFWWTIPAAAACALVAGVVIGAPTLRLRSDYLAIVTLGFGEMVTAIITINFEMVFQNLLGKSLSAKIQIRGSQILYIFVQKHMRPCSDAEHFACVKLRFQL